jgi:hypothetical protein
LESQLFHFEVEFNSAADLLCFAKISFYYFVNDDASMGFLFFSPHRSGPVVTAANHG